MINLREFIVRQRHVKSSNIIFEVTEAFGARNGDDILTLSKHPSKRELGRRAALSLCEVLHMGCKLKIALEGLSLEARIRVPPVIIGKIGWLLYRAREETAPKRTVRHEADAQLTTRRKRSVALDITRPKRVLALQRGNRMHRVRFSQSADARFRKAESTHFARANQLRHRTDSFLNGNSRINPVLIIEIDRIDPQAAKTSVARLSHVGRRTVCAAYGAVRIYPEAKFRGDDDLLSRDVPEKSTEKLLILIRAVDLRRVKKVTSHFEVALKNTSAPRTHLSARRRMTCPCNPSQAPKLQANQVCVFS